MYTLYIAAAIGAVIYGLIDYLSEKGNEVLTKKYLLITVVNILAGCAVIWATELKEGIMQLGWFDAAKIIAITMGVTGQKLFKALISITDSTIKTKIGINRDIQKEGDNPPEPPTPPTKP